MSAEFEKAVQSAMDGELSAEAQAALNNALRNEPPALEAYCRQLRVHSLLAWRAGLATSPVEKKIVAFPVRRNVLRWAGWAAAALIVFSAVFFMMLPSRASATLERMLAVAARSGDRSYKFQVLAGEKTIRLINNQSASFEGAMLHLGGGGQFVYECELSDGSRRISGSDGVMSWDIIGHSPVHLSKDPARFRHHLPGEREHFTFLDPYSQLVMLREGYVLSLAGEVEPGIKLLKATKQSRAFRGPREVVISFDEKTSTIQGIDLIGLPQARGGPSALRLTLTSNAKLPADFFSHTSHHEPDRRVLYE